jgi:ligand-binding sensor domain-containing protein
MWTTYNIDDGLADNDVQVIYQDNEFNIWIGTKK